MVRTTKRTKLRLSQTCFYKPVALLLYVQGEEAHTHYKPLGLWFDNLAQLILVDDEKFKLKDKERGNGLFIPGWQKGRESPLVLRTLAVRLSKLG